MGAGGECKIAEMAAIADGAHAVVSHRQVVLATLTGSLTVGGAHHTQVAVDMVAGAVMLRRANPVQH